MKEQNVDQELCKLFENSFLGSLSAFLRSPGKGIMEWVCLNDNPKTWKITNIEKFRQIKMPGWGSPRQFLYESKRYGFVYNDLNMMAPTVSHTFFGLNTTREQWYDFWLDDKIKQFMGTESGLLHLYNTLNSQALKRIAYWDQDGKTIIVENIDLFQSFIGKLSIERKGFWLRCKEQKLYLHHPCIKPKCQLKNWIIPYCTVFKITRNKSKMEFKTFESMCIAEKEKSQPIKQIIKKGLQYRKSIYKGVQVIEIL